MDSTEQFIVLQNQIESLKWFLGTLSTIGALLLAYLTTRVQTLGEIKQKLKNIDDLSNIEATVTKAVKDVEYNFWKKQETEKLHRQKIEELYRSVMNDTDALYQTTSRVVHQSDITTYQKSDMLFTIIPHLYFKNLIPIQRKYFDQREKVINKISEAADTIKTNYKVPDHQKTLLNKELDFLKAIGQKFLHEIISLSENLEITLKDSDD